MRRKVRNENSLSGFHELSKSGGVATFNHFMRSEFISRSPERFPCPEARSTTFARRLKTAGAILVSGERLRALQFMIRFILGALLLVPLVAVFLLFCAVAVITDKAARAR